MPENAELYNKYKKLADETPNVHFVGRLATYKYYNMDQVVAQALTLYKRLTERENAAKPARPAISGSTSLVEKLVSRSPKQE
jgi:UDP-galactopyranose mutase